MTLEILERWKIESEIHLVDRPQMAKHKDRESRLIEAVEWQEEEFEYAVSLLKKLGYVLADKMAVEHSCKLGQILEGSDDDN